MGTSSRERRGNRSWPEGLKREIVAASLVPGSSVSLVARQYDVNANQVFAWRKRYGPNEAEAPGLRLLPVTVIPDRPVEAAPACGAGLIEIELSCGYRLRIGSRVKAPALRLVLDVLEGR